MRAPWPLLPSRMAGAAIRRLLLTHASDGSSIRTMRSLRLPKTRCAPEPRLIKKRVCVETMTTRSCCRCSQTRGARPRNGCGHSRILIEIQRRGRSFRRPSKGCARAQGYSAGGGAGVAASIGTLGRSICSDLITLREMIDGNGGPFERASNMAAATCRSSSLAAAKSC